MGLIEGRAKLRSAFNRLTEEGLDAKTRPLTVGLARAAAGGAGEDVVVARWRELDAIKRTQAEKLEALRFFFTELDTLTRKHKVGRPDEFRAAVTAKIEELERLKTQPGAPVAELDARIAWLRRELEPSPPPPPPTVSSLSSSSSSSAARGPTRPTARRAVSR